MIITKRESKDADANELNDRIVSAESEVKHHACDGADKGREEEASLALLLQTHQQN